jgi:hypothetical protein
MSCHLTACTTPVCRAGAFARPARAATVLLLAFGFTFMATATAAAAPAAPASEPAVAVAELIELNKQAVLDYTAGRHEAAAKTLKDALVLADKGGLGGHDMAARTHVHLGIVLIAGLGQRDEGLHQFARARALRPAIKLTKQLATPKLLQEFEASAKVAPTKLETVAKAKEPPAAKEPPPAPAPATNTGPAGTVVATEKTVEKAVAEDAEPDLPMNVPLPLYCPTPMEGPPQADVRLHCLTQQNVPARQVVMFYRPGDGETYTAVPMNRTKKGWFSAVIPARQVTGRAMQFYFEARGDAGAVAAANGKGELPNVLVLKDGAPPVGVGALAALTFDGEDTESDVEEETPLEAREKLEQQEEAEALLSRRGAGRFWAGLGVGSGYGWHLRRPLENHKNRQVSPGFSSVGLAHATPELGYQLTRRLALSIQTRHQYLPPNGSGDAEVSSGPPRSAHAVLLRASYALLDLGNFQLLGSASVGYGSALRMRVDPTPAAGLVSSDTIVAGPGVAGPGLAIAYNISNNLIAALEARTLVGFPKLGALLEGTGALQYAF